jgi:predicted dinucleotide-binding enzyme
VSSPSAGLPSLAGRVVIDVMNRLGGDPARSTSQDLADLLPGARIVKAFNTIGFENLTAARARVVPAAMFVASDDPDAKRVALELAAELGFRAEDAGSLANAKPLEGMVKVWLALAQQHGRTVGSQSQTAKRRRWTDRRVHATSDGGQTRASLAYVNVFPPR